VKPHLSQRGNTPYSGAVSHKFRVNYTAGSIPGGGFRSVSARVLHCGVGKIGFPAAWRDLAREIC